MQKKKPAAASNASGLLLITGIIFIIGSTIIGLVIKCPTQIQSFNIYTLIGVGMACLFFKSAGQSAISYKSSKFSSKIVGCIAVPILLFVINPIDRIKANGCDSPKENTTFNNGPTISPDTILGENKSTILRITVQCRGRTKKGTRCKHYTSNENGYCFQHQSW